MRYRNIRTGAVIESAARITGGGWVEDRPFPAASQRPVPVRQEAEEMTKPAAEPAKTKRKKAAGK